MTRTTESRRLRMRFSHRGADGRLYWYSQQLPGDSRVVQLSCNAAWLYDQMVTD